MKKKVIKRFLAGFPSGVAIGYVITILVSAMIGTGRYYACSTAFSEAVGSELGAVIVQALLCGIQGGGYAAASVIWERDDWSLLRQTGVYLLTISLLMMPIAYICCWMEHSVKGFLIYFGIFLLIFCVIWGIQYQIGRRRIRKMNAGLQKAKMQKSEE